ncbi:hypothetical protein OUZ56_033690 [Daphnia magna]|uniref:Uncharacterized protein n=1 Tax=Daphnia magna TaxID=35525 RepID=A0ABR0BB07_9CRUS|nr:hypothetical protein OUZ56_033690 [Daphnia magna]
MGTVRDIFQQLGIPIFQTILQTVPARCSRGRGLLDVDILGHRPLVMICSPAKFSLKLFLARRTIEEVHLSAVQRSRTPSILIKKSGQLTKSRYPETSQSGLFGFALLSSLAASSNILLTGEKGTILKTRQSGCGPSGSYQVVDDADEFLSRTKMGLWVNGIAGDWALPCPSSSIAGIPITDNS